MVTDITDADTKQIYLVCYSNPYVINIVLLYLKKKPQKYLREIKDRIYMYMYRNVSNTD